MFDTLIVQPIFNLLVFIYAILPGHNFGIALIIFTVIIRMLMWPLVKKQLHQVKVMRKIQPELKKIKAATKGDRQKESLMTMALYKEYGVNPFSSIGVLLLQLPILLGLYSGIMKIVKDPETLVSFAYAPIQDLSWMQHLAQNISAFDATLFGVVDLMKPAITGGAIYWPAMIIVIASAVIQFFQSKQLMPSSKEARKLRDILKAAGEGKQADQSEVNASISRTTVYMLPAMVFIFTIHLASALSLYWLVGGLVAYIQQSIILREDKDELLAKADKPTGKDAGTIIEGEVIDKPATKAKSSKKAGKTKKRRK